MAQIGRPAQAQQAVDAPGVSECRGRRKGGCSGIRVRGLGNGRRGRGGVFGEPVAEEGDDGPVEVGVRGGDALASVGGEGEAEEAAFDLGFEVVELVDLVFDELEDGVGDVAQLGGAGGPLADDVDERFGEDDLGAGEVAELEVAGRVLGDLFPEPALELQQVVVDAGADDFEGVVDVGEVEEGFALRVGFGDVDAVEGGRVVVEDPEEVVVVAHDWVVGVGGHVALGYVDGGLHGGDRSEEAA